MADGSTRVQNVICAIVGKWVGCSMAGAGCKIRPVQDSAVTLAPLGCGI